MIPFIIYISPAGTTRHVATAIQNALTQKGLSPVTLDLADREDIADTISAIEKAGDQAFVFVGSPVYSSKAVPPVMSFLEALPENSKGFAAVFATWGMASSGVALWQMGRVLAAKGFSLAGGAKVGAVHSVMFNSEDPEGKGHPDASDDEIVTNMVTRVAEQFEKGELSPISLETLDYQPEAMAAEAKKSLDAPRKTMGKTVDEETCTQCGTCEENCPSGAIVLDPYPQIGEACFDCLNCVRLCPEEAIATSVDLDALSAKIRAKVQKVNEQPKTQVFM